MLSKGMQGPLEEMPFTISRVYYFLHLECRQAVIVRIYINWVINPYRCPIFPLNGKCPKISYTLASDKFAYANSADPDQTAPSGAVWSGSTLFAIPLSFLRKKKLY